MLTTVQKTNTKPVGGERVLASPHPWALVAVPAPFSDTPGATFGPSAAWAGRGAARATKALSRGQWD